MNNHNDFNAMIKQIRKLPTEECILRNTRRVSVFRFVDALVLLNKAYDTKLIKDLFVWLISNGEIFKVEYINNITNNNTNNNINNNNNNTNNNTNKVDIVLKGNLTSTDLFIWAKEDNSTLNIILLFMVLVMAAGLAITKKWPSWYRYVLYYLRYPILAFFVFMLAAAVVRLVVYLVTLFVCKEQCWIWPNLFADCGFIESFRPMYEWTNTNSGSSNGSGNNDTNDNILNSNTNTNILNSNTKDNTNKEYIDKNK
ncbi:SEC62 [Ecytonucleospora hepatopenaei]|uniref:Translocation protein SEC62 n=1 Tax=Ecytonucleospora hepatopenaei TaxID=646526 RepID=A0A1W0E469_9MICR|nr:SEC62 [Ecytonucleospora hepatopenaei]